MRKQKNFCQTQESNPNATVGQSLQAAAARLLLPGARPERLREGRRGPEVVRHPAAAPAGGPPQQVRRPAWRRRQAEPQVEPQAAVESRWNSGPRWDLGGTAVEPRWNSGPRWDRGGNAVEPQWNRSGTASRGGGTVVERRGAVMEPRCNCGGAAVGTGWAGARAAHHAGMFEGILLGLIGLYWVGMGWNGLDWVGLGWIGFAPTTK